jgi:hypothetical protein
MNHEEMKRIWESAKGCPPPGSVVESTPTPRIYVGYDIGGPGGDESVMVIMEGDKVIDLRTPPHPGVDNQGDAVVVEDTPPRLPAPDENPQ